MGYIIIGLAVAFNMLIIKAKLEKKRYEDALFDGLCLIIITLIFSGSYGGLVVGTVASAVISLYLLASPPTFFTKSKKLDEFKKSVKKTLKEDFELNI